MNKINIFINQKKFEAKLNDTETAQEIYNILPLKREANFWGNEIYFSIPLKKENEKPTEDLKVGDLGFWPEGKAFCIFYGKTPASKNEKPRPASAVTKIGRIKGEFEFLKGLNEAEVKVEK